MPNSVQLASDPVKPTKSMVQNSSSVLPLESLQMWNLYPRWVQQEVTPFYASSETSDILCGTEFWSPDYIYSTNIIEHATGSQAAY